MTEQTPTARLIEWARDNMAFPVGNPGGEGRGHIDENHRFKLRDMVGAIDATAPKADDIAEGLRALRDAAEQEADDIRYYGGPSSASYAPKNDAYVAALKAALPQLLADRATASGEGLPDREDIARVLFDQRQTSHDFDDAADDADSDAGCLRSICFDDADAVLALASLPASQPVADVGGREWPEIGPNPFKGPSPRDKAAGAERLKQAYVLQQPIVPNQTALVWRVDLGDMRTALQRSEARRELAERRVATLTARVGALEGALRSVRAEIGPAKHYAEQSGLPGGKLCSAVHIKLDLIDGYARDGLAALASDPACEGGE